MIIIGCYFDSCFGNNNVDSSRNLVLRKLPSATSFDSSTEKEELRSNYVVLLLYYPCFFHYSFSGCFCFSYLLNTVNTFNLSIYLFIFKNNKQAHLKNVIETKSDFTA